MHYRGGIANIVILVVGLCIGIVLTGLSILAAGFGHGSYVLLGLVSSPLGVFGILPALLLTPVLWLAIILLAKCAGGKVAARSFLILMIAHIFGAVFLLSIGPFADWKYFPLTEFYSFAGIVVYILAQCATWVIFLYSKALGHEIRQRNVPAHGHRADDA